MDKSQLDAAIRKEMLGEDQEGTNSETETSTETEEPGDAQAKAESDDATAKKDEDNSEKRRSNVPKILRERNELRRKVEELNKKLSERTGSAEADELPDIDARIAAVVEDTIAARKTQEFFESNPDARAKRKAVEGIMDDHGLTVSDAWTLYLAKNDPKALAKNYTKALSTPSVPNFGNRRDKAFEQLSANDQKAHLKNLIGKGEITL